MNSFLEIQHLNLKVGNHKILRNVSFKCKKGHIIGLIGPNGAGKTTIIKCILGLYPYRHANIKLNGLSIKNRGVLNLGIGALIERPAIYPFLTGYEHLTMYAKHREHIKSVVSSLNMQSFINEKSKTYSLGMKQKLGIAIALLDNPQLLILDEPMNGLDPQSNYQLRNLLLSLSKQGITILISSHILSELEKIIDDIIILDNGKVVLSTSKAELQQQAQNDLIFTTNDNVKILNLLLNNNFKVTKSNDHLEIFHITVPKLNEFLRLIVENNIQLELFVNKRTDLESTLLNLLGSVHN